MIQSLQRSRGRRRRLTTRSAPPTSVGATAVIPYDYGASFKLRGVPGNLVQDVINITADGVFVAVAIGYGFEEDRTGKVQVRPRLGERQVPDPVVPGNLTLGNLPPAALIEGIRLDPAFEPIAIPPLQAATPGVPGGARGSQFSDQPLPLHVVSELFQRVKPPAEISFLFSMLDTGSGRELQDEPTHNLASLGKSNGERPFRPLAQPLTFLPRSTLRLQIVERSEGVTGTLFIVLYGYKMLSNSNCPEPLVRSFRGSPTCPTETIGRPSDRVIPFDYVAALQLNGTPGNIVEEEISINADGGFVATSLGYGLAAEQRDVELQWPAPAAIDDADLKKTATARLLHLRELDRNSNATVPPPSIKDLATVPLRFLPASAWTDGFRVRPSFVRVAFQNGGQLAHGLSVDLADRIFERLNRVEDVSFRYSIFDSGTGRELQNRPLHNIAGLGIATGDRPFKRFARPMIFRPRSTIRVAVQEQFGRGTLYLVFQGYKVLSASRGARP